MSRRTYYMTAIVLFVPIIVWYAGKFSTVPVLTFSQAHVVADSTGDSKKVIVPGTIVESKGIEEGGSEITFYLADATEQVERVDYDGSEKIDPAALREAAGKGREIRVAGHICGERFHAKNLFLE